eukprot:1025253-Pelagomonas_calceolata.AAC.6
MQPCAVHMEQTRGCSTPNLVLLLEWIPFCFPYWITRSQVCGAVGVEYLRSKPVQSGGQGHKECLILIIGCLIGYTWLQWGLTFSQ